MILVVKTQFLSRPAFSSLLPAGLLLCLLLMLVACSKPQPTKLYGSTMGTSYSVIIPQLPESTSETTVHEGIDAVLERVNQEMSTYLPDSELSQINQSEGGQWLQVSPAVFGVINLAQSISEQTGGAYDITVGPLVNLWGFGPPTPGAEGMPTDEEVKAARALVGYHKLELNPQGRTLRKKFKDLYIDLSSIAKGYGVDAVADYLESVGITDYLVEIGGEIRAKGKSQRGDAWRIAVEKPVPGERAVQKIVNLSDIAVATSGDYRNFVEYNGVRYSHTIDPRKGGPIHHALASVTVLSEKAVNADAWATALMVLGEVEGLKLAEEKGLAAYFLYKKGDGFESEETTAFMRLAEH
jgi:FAD:protein FMN transferase